MKIFMCNDRVETKLCCIYTAWECALKVGYDKVGMMVEPVTEPTLFDEYIHVGSLYKSSKIHKEQHIGHCIYVCVLRVSVRRSGRS